MNMELIHSINEFSKNYDRWTSEVGRIFRMVDNTNDDDVEVFRIFLGNLLEDLPFKEDFLKKLQKRLKTNNFVENDKPPYLTHDVY